MFTIPPFSIHQLVSTIDQLVNILAAYEFTSILTQLFRLTDIEREHQVRERITGDLRTGWLPRIDSLLCLTLYGHRS